MRRFGKLSAGLFAAMFMMTGGNAWAGDAIGTIYQGGKIYTMQEAKVDANNRLIPISKDTKPVMAEFVVTKNGVIEYVGEIGEAIPEKYLTDEYKKVDLKGKTMYPGFVDGHSHFPLQGEDDLTMVNLNSSLLGGTVDSHEALQAAIKARVEKLTDKNTIIIGYNYDDTLMKDENGKIQGHPTAKLLDEVSGGHPVYIKHISKHVAVANTRLMQDSGVFDLDFTDPKNSGVVCDEDGKPTGLLLETEAMGKVSLAGPKDAPYTKDTPGTNAILARASEIYAAAGVTTADNGGSVYFMDIPSWQAGLATGNLGVRVVSHPFGYYAGGLGDFNKMALGWFPGQAPSKDVPSTGADITTIDVSFLDAYVGSFGMKVPPTPEKVKGMENRIFLGAWKFIYDGSPQAYTAWMKNPGYYDWSEHKPDKNDAGFTTSQEFKFDGKSFSGLAGTMNIGIDQMADLLTEFHKYGFSTETHTNGSACAEAWVAAVEKAVQNPEAANVKDTRHTSIHGQTLERQHIERMTGNYDALADTAGMYTDFMGAGGKAKAEVGNLPQLMKDQNIFTSFFNNHVYFYGDRHHDIFFGPGRAMNISPAGWAQAYGMPYSFHNDTDVTPIDPLRSIQTGVTRLTADGKLLSKAGETNVDAKVTYDTRKVGDKTSDPAEFWAYDHRVTALQAIHAVTTGPAWQNKLENKIGKIAPQMMADFTIMDKDIIQQAEEDPTKIADMRIAATIVGDEVIYGVLPADDNFVSTPTVSAVQTASNVVVTMTSAETLKKEEVVKQYAPCEDGEELLGAVSMTATVENGDTAVFAIKILGNGKKVNDIKMVKFLSDATKANFDFIGSTAEFEDFATNNELGGKWWINKFEAPLATDILSKSDELELDKMYIISFAVQNDSPFDSNTTDPGVITDPAGVISTSGTTPDNGASVTEEANKQEKSSGGSDGGCTVGTNPAYELLALLLAALGVTAARGLRRRDA